MEGEYDREDGDVAEDDVDDYGPEDGFWEGGGGVADFLSWGTRELGQRKKRRGKSQTTYTYAQRNHTPSEYSAAPTTRSSTLTHHSTNSPRL